MIKLSKNDILERWYLFSPIIVFPVSIFKQVDIQIALRIFCFVLVGLLLIDFAVDRLTSSLRKIFKAWFLTSLLAFSTNLPELSVTTISALKGDGFLVAPGAALGSNFVNVLLVTLALGIVFFLSFLSASVKSATKSFDYLGGLKQIGLALFYGCIAVIYYPIAQADTSYLAFWVLIVLTIVTIFGLTNFYSKQGKKISLLSHITVHTVNNLLDSIREENAVRDFLIYLNKVIAKPKDYSIDDLLACQELEAIKKLSDEEIESVRSKLSKDLKDDLDEILELFGISQHLDSPGYVYYLQAFISVLFIATGSYFLDLAGDLMSTGFNLNKGLISFFVLSFLTSAGEFLTSYKFFMNGKFRDGWRNVADSNLCNLLIAVFVVIIISSKNLTN